MMCGRSIKKASKVCSWALAAIAISAASSASAQYFPTVTAYHSNATGTSPVPVGVAIATVPARTQATEVLAVLTFQGNRALTYYSHDAQTYVITGQVATNNTPYCDSVSHTDHCSPSIVNFNGTPYLSYRDINNNLEIWKGTLAATADDYSWTNVAIINSGYGPMATSPQMVVAFGKIMIIYGVQSINNITNALVNTSSSDGATWSTTDAGLGALTYAAPTQVGLSVFGSKLYMVTQQNNSQRHLYYWSTSDGVNWTGAENTSLYVDSGLSMVTYNNNLVFATKQNNSDDHLFFFSSPNGTTWYAQQETPVIQENTTPALTTFNGGIALIYLYNTNTASSFQAGFASH